MAAFNLTNEVRSVLCQLILFGSGGAHWLPCRTPGSGGASRQKYWILALRPDGGGLQLKGRRVGEGTWRENGVHNNYSRAAHYEA